ncbi:MAG: hypothetical protein WA733_14875 [Methylocystis sp.]
MNAFLDKRDFMAELEEFEKHLLRSGIKTQSKDGALADFPPLVARREDARQSVVDPQSPRPGEARRDDGDPAKSETESVQRTDFAAIEAELRHARGHAARTEPLGTATSNAVPSLADELKSQRHGAEIVVSDPVGVADERAASRRSLYIVAGIVVAGLAGLGLGNAFWNDASNPPDASSVNTEAGLVKPPSQVTTSADIPAQQSSMLDSSVSPPPATSGGDAEQLVDASRPQAETPPAVAREGETGLANQTVGAPASPIATQMQAEPVGMATLPEPKKAETASTAPPDAALRPSDAPAQATAAPSLPPRTPAAAAPASTPKTAPRAQKAPKPSVAAKSGDPRQPGRIAKPAKAVAAEKAAQPDSTQPPITQPEALTSKPAATPESSGAFAYVQRAQQAVGSLAGIVKNWVGMDAGPRP